jgi:hypothetical protein
MVEEIETVVDALPPEFVAVIVNVVAEKVVLGVPLILPVEDVKPNPAGSEGEIVQPVAVPPVFVGVNEVIG